MAEDLSDKDLLAGFNIPESRNYYFNLLIQKYQKKLYWHIRRIVIDHDDADDVIQNTFIKVWNNLSSFKGESTLFTWLFRIATNESLSHLRKKRTRFFIPIISVEKYLVSKLRSEPSMAGEKIQHKLQEAIAKLPEKQRIVFNMKYFEELTYEEISGILNTSIGALKASYHHAVKKIEKILSAD